MGWDNQDIFVTGSAFTTTPGGSATVILWDSTNDPGTGVTLSIRRGYPELKRGKLTVLVDQAATFKINGLARNSSTWRTLNGGGAGEPIAANTWFERSVLLPSDDHQIIIATGTAPTVWEVTLRLSPDQALDQ